MIRAGVPTLAHVRSDSFVVDLLTRTRAGTAMSTVEAFASCLKACFDRRPEGTAPPSPNHAAVAACARGHLARRYEALLNVVIGRPAAAVREDPDPAG